MGEGNSVWNFVPEIGNISQVGRGGEGERRDKEQGSARAQLERWDKTQRARSVSMR
jgi:hypothetical protein